MADNTKESSDLKTHTSSTAEKPPQALRTQAADSLTSQENSSPVTELLEKEHEAAKNVYGDLALAVGTDNSTVGPGETPNALTLKGYEANILPDTQVIGKGDAEKSTPSQNPDMDGAHEVVKDTNGEDKLVPLTKLEAGDHTIALKDGREFMMHVPINDGKEKLPVMFMFSGSGEGQWDIKDFVPESGMNTKADDPNNKFIAVYPLPQRHLLGTGSDKTAFGWNVLDEKGGVLIDKADSQKAGYDDMTYVKNIAELIPKVANVDADHKDWAGVGFSQGGVFLNYLASNVPHLFPTIAPVGTAVDTRYDYDIKPGNAQNVDIVNLRGDLSTLPFLDNTSDEFKTEEVLRDVLPKFVFEKLDDLAPINNSQASPEQQMTMYEARLGPSTSHTSMQTTPTESSTIKDSITEYTPDDPNNHNRMTVVDLAIAQHSYPEADPSGKRTNATTKYTEFDTDQQIVDSWFKFNKEQKD